MELCSVVYIMLKDCDWWDLESIKSVWLEGFGDTYTLYWEGSMIDLNFLITWDWAKSKIGITF